MALYMLRATGTLISNKIHSTCKNNSSNIINKTSNSNILFFLFHEIQPWNMANYHRILSSELNGFWFPKAGLCIVAAVRTSLTSADFSFNGVLFCIIYAALAECDFQAAVLCLQPKHQSKAHPSEERVREPLLGAHKSVGPGRMHLWVHRLLVDIILEPLLMSGS